MKVLIFGATGLLGNALMREWKHNDQHELIGFSSKDADIRDEEQVALLIEHFRPDWVVLLAAYTDVDGAESNEKLAFAVNVAGAANVAIISRRFNAKLLFVSTDYLFDGRKSSPYEIDDVPAPLSVYGKSKLKAEQAVRKNSPDACIVRTSWLFGVGGKCFPETILKLAASKPELEVVDDQRGSPTYTVDLARAIIQLCEKNAKGTVHVTNRGDCTWFEFAREIVVQAGLTTVVNPTTSDKFVRPAPRPRYSVLSAKSLDAFGIVTADWRDALRRYFRERDS